MEVRLSAEEREILISMLMTAISDMKGEIHHTKNFQFKDDLKQQKHLMEGLLQRIANPEEILG